MSNRFSRINSTLSRLTSLDKTFLALAVFAGFCRIVERVTGYNFPLPGLLAFVLSVLGLVVGIKYLFWLIRRTVWRLRNRLILTYLFIGVVPIVLILAMQGIGMYVLMGQVATYLLTTEMKRRNEVVRDCAYALAWNVADHWGSGSAETTAGEFLKQLQHRLPKLQAILRVHERVWSVLPNARLSEFPAWSQDGFQGLISLGSEYAMAAHVRVRQSDLSIEVFTYEPTEAGLLAGLLPGLASVNFLELQIDPSNEFLKIEEQKLTQDAVGGSQHGQPEFTFRSDPASNDDPAYGESFVLPPAQAWWDVGIRWVTPMPVQSWKADHTGPSQILVGVVSRPSLIIRQLFSTLGPLARSVRFLLFLVGGLFLLVEIASLVLGVGLTRSITRSVSDLYEGTLRVNAGDFRNRITIRSQDQLSELASSFNRMTANIEKLIAESKEKERLESDLEIAREVQSQLFPQSVPRLRGLEVMGLCQPARMVSGDYYDFIHLNSNWTALAIGDVAGKGISAALLMATIQSSIRSQLNLSRSSIDGVSSSAVPPSTAELTALLNRQLYEGTSPEKFATFFLAFYNEADSQLFYTNAGHLPPILLREKKAQRLDISGMVLGAFPDQSYERVCLQLQAGDLLAAFTDGLTEPENEYGEEFGERRLISLLVQNAQRPLEEIAERLTTAVQEWSATTEQVDDKTLLLVRRI